MTLKDYITALEKKHQKLSKQIDAIYLQPNPDGLELLALKKQKLQLKEKIKRFLR